MITLADTFTVTDIDGNLYHTITIGSQIWMVENLKTTKYRNGDPIQKVVDNTKWSKLKNGAWCNYDNNSNNGNTYGRLYNWFAVNDSRKIAPVGWHVTTEHEWETLINILGDNASGKLKETGSKHWESPNKGATNETGFTALPGAYNNYKMKFSGIGNYGSWWSSTESCEAKAWCWLMYYYDRHVYKRRFSKQGGISVRCMKDKTI